jgi:drug/metabolite transporter (DMT)-like permease
VTIRAGPDRAARAGGGLTIRVGGGTARKRVNRPRRAPARDTRAQSSWRAYAALALTVSGIAWSPVFVRWADVPGTASGFYRVLIAAVVLIPWRLARGSAQPVDRRAVFLAIAGGAFFALDLAFWNTSVLRTKAAIASLLGNNTPIVVGLASWWIFKRRPSRAFWAGLALSVSGCIAIVAVESGGGAAAARHSLSGDVLALVASIFFAAYLITTERIREHMDTLTFNSLAIAGSVITLLVACLLLRVPLTGYPLHTWGALLALGLISQLAAYYLLVYALGQLPATITSVGLLAQVPFTAVLAMLLLGEPLTAWQWAGGALVLIGIYLVNRFDGN